MLNPAKGTLSLWNPIMYYGTGADRFSRHPFLFMQNNFFIPLSYLPGNGY